MHVVQRGHDRRECFRQDSDNLVYLSNLRDLSQKTGCAIHAYCLMTNHVHLLLTPSEPQSCGLLMRNLGQRYVQYFNRRYDRRGTLWEGRFYSCLVDSASYVLACHRYIESNPVRAKMVDSASRYLWSSYAGNSGGSANGLLTPHVEYEALGSGPEQRHAAYQELFAKPEDPAFIAALRDATYGGFALVGERLKAALPASVQARLTRGTPGRPAKAEPEDVDIAVQLGLRPGFI